MARIRNKQKLAWYKAQRKKNPKVSDVELLSKWKEKVDKEAAEKKAKEDEEKAKIEAKKKALEAIDLAWKEKKAAIETEKKAKEEAERIAKLPTTTTTTPAPTTTTTTTAPEPTTTTTTPAPIVPVEVVKDANVSSITETNITTPANPPVEPASVPVINADVIIGAVIDANLIATKPPTE